MSLHLTEPLFVFVLLPLILGGFYVAKMFSSRLSILWLTLSSLLWCGAQDLVALYTLVVLAAFNYVCCIGICNQNFGQQHRNLIFRASILAHIGIFVAYKFYFGHVSEEPGREAEEAFAWIITTPMGFAFYMLQMFSALFVSRKLPEVSLSPGRHLLWSGFISQLPSGPIFTYDKAAPQYQKLGTGADKPQFALGVTLITFGLIKYFVIAVPLFPYVHGVFQMAKDGVVPFIDAWFASWGFTAQLYFAFSAYSDIAIGIAACVGIRLPANFDSPLKARSASELFSRWHITLVDFFRKHLFLPLFLSVNKLFSKRGPSRVLLSWAIALVATMVVIGMWHSLGVSTILAWTALASIAILMRLIIEARKAGMRSNQAVPTGRSGGNILLLFALCITSTYIASADAGVAKNILSGMFDISSLSVSTWLAPHLPWALDRLVDANGFLAVAPHGALHPLLTLSVATATIFFCPNTMRMTGVIDGGDNDSAFNWQQNRVWGCVTGLLLIVYISFWAKAGAGPVFAYAGI